MARLLPNLNFVTLPCNYHPSLMSTGALGFLFKARNISAEYSGLVEVTTAARDKRSEMMAGKKLSSWQKGAHRGTFLPGTRNISLIVD